MTATGEEIQSSRAWRAAEACLLVVWLFAGILAMYPAVARAVNLDHSLFTSYAADLTNPAWLYLVLRRKSDRGIGRWFARTPELAALSIFIGATLTELSQRFWPRGFFAGTFDPLDIAMYGLGIAACYVADRRLGKS